MQAPTNSGISKSTYLSIRCQGCNHTDGLIAMTVNWADATHAKPAQHHSAEYQNNSAGAVGRRQPVVDSACMPLTSAVLQMALCCLDECSATAAAVSCKRKAAPHMLNCNQGVPEAFQFKVRQHFLQLDNTRSFFFFFALEVRRFYTKTNSAPY